MENIVFVVDSDDECEKKPKPAKRKREEDQRGDQRKKISTNNGPLKTSNYPKWLTTNVKRLSKLCRWKTSQPVKNSISWLNSVLHPAQTPNGLKAEPKDLLASRQPKKKGKVTTKKKVQTKMNQYQKSRTKKYVPNAQTLERTRKIRIYPNNEQKQAFNRWFGAARYTWNQVVDEIYEKNMPKDWEAIRDRLVTLKNISDEEKEEKSWLYDETISPAWLRELVVKDVLSSIKATEASLEARGVENRYKMKYKSKKDTKETVTLSCGGGNGWTVKLDEQLLNPSGTGDTDYTKPIDYLLKGFTFRSSCVHGIVEVKGRKELKKITNNIYKQSGSDINKKIKLKTAEIQKLKSKKDKNLFKKLQNAKKRLETLKKLKDSKEEKKVVRRQVKLVREKPDCYYLCIIFNHEPKPEKVLREECDVIALDPGVRTFQTGYDLKGNFYEFGKGDHDKLLKVGQRLDRLVSKCDKVEKKRKNRTKRRRMNKAKRKLRSRIQNLVTDAHWKLSRYLTTNFYAVIIPKFNVSDMTEKVDRKINCKTVRQMVTWSHFKFRQRLFQKAEETSHCIVHEVTEEDTSRTCGNPDCGRINYKLGGNKTFVCVYCNWTIDRDMNGARNILLKNVEKCGIAVR